jgi:hypothetical protein
MEILSSGRTRIDLTSGIFISLSPGRISWKYTTSFDALQELNKAKPVISRNKA